MNTKTTRIGYIDGMKGFCLLSIITIHFLLQFMPYGYVGWSCPDEGVLNPVSFYFDNFPYSILTNNSFPLYIFIGVAAFIPAYKYFADGKALSLQRQAVTRYFRLMPMTVVACLLSVLLFKTNLTPYADFFELTGNNWINGRIGAFDYTYLNALKTGLFDAYIRGTNAVSSLWCLHYFFLGTFLTAAILLLFGKMKCRAVIYCALGALLWSSPAYLSFLVCIASADIVCHRSEEGKKLPYALMLVFGIIIGLFPPVLLPKWLDVSVLYAIGSFGVVTGTAVLFKDNRILCSRYICRLGQKSFAGIIMHIFVLFSVNQYLFMWLDRTGLAFGLNVAINFIVYMALSLAATELYDFLLTPVTNKLCQKVTRIFKLNS